MVERDWFGVKRMVGFRLVAREGLTGEGIKRTVNIDLNFVGRAEATKIHTQGIDYFSACSHWCIAF